MSDDPACTNPDKYKVVFENEDVRVLEYIDHPGDWTSPHVHPDSVMYTLSSFRSRVYGGDGESRDVEIEAGHDRVAARPTACRAQRRRDRHARHLRRAQTPNVEDGSTGSVRPSLRLGPGIPRASRRRGLLH